jgi:hypothetical protein
VTRRSVATNAVANATLAAMPPIVSAVPQVVAACSVMRNVETAAVRRIVPPRSKAPRARSSRSVGSARQQIAKQARPRTKLSVKMPRQPTASVTKPASGGPAVSPV